MKLFTLFTKGLQPFEVPSREFLAKYSHCYDAVPKESYLVSEFLIDISTLKPLRTKRIRLKQVKQCLNLLISANNVVSLGICIN